MVQVADMFFFEEQDFEPDENEAIVHQKKNNNKKINNSFKIKLKKAKLSQFFFWLI